MSALVSRFVDWFWLRGAERAVRAEVAGSSPGVVTLVTRAHAAREVAARTSRPPAPFARPGSLAVAAELYCEAIEWALLAHARRRGEGHSDSGANAPRGRVGEADRALLRSVVDSDVALERLLAELGRTYFDFADLDQRAQRAVLERLERASEALLEPLGTPSERLRRIRARRLVHLVGGCLAFVAMVLVLRNVAQAAQRANDLAIGARWTTSSQATQGGCPSPRQLCFGGEHFFFHTAEETDPWIIFDLGKVEGISGIEIDNRLDCCTERANPLAVAVSTDKLHWQEIARHTADFARWRERFPTVRGRYVKLHVPRTNAVLHLSKVLIFP